MRCFFIGSWLMIASLFLLGGINAQVASVKFIVKVPAMTQIKTGVFLAGSFNGWSTHDSLYKMTDETGGIFSLVVPLFDGKIYKYKYTLGNWNVVEIQANDSEIVNRQVLSRNGMVQYDTVSKWKTPPSASKTPPSAQMQRLMAIKDSAAIEVKAMLSDLLIQLKQYNENMLSPKPSERLHKKQKKETVDLLAKVYSRIEKLIWDMGSSLSPEQKMKITEAMKKSKAPGDVINTIKDAYAEVLK